MNETYTYEDLYARLSLIVSQLEGGELSLADSLSLYEEGTRLAAACQEMLDQAELRVQQLTIMPQTTAIDD